MAAQSHVADIARILIDAENAGRQTDKIINSYPDLSERDAYAAQLAVVEQRLNEGQTVVGKKVALTNRAVQQVLGVDQPVFGHLLSGMMVAESEPISCSTLLQPKIEPEIAFVMKRDLFGPGVTAASVLWATAGVVPALEIPGPRIRDWKFTVRDIAADNAFGSKVVLGGVLTPLKGLDLRLVGVMFERNGQLVSTGAGAAALGNPVDVVAWLANKLAEFGVGLKAGDVVLPGALVVAPDVHPGEHYKATFDRLGPVSANFVE